MIKMINECLSAAASGNLLLRLLLLPLIAAATRLFICLMVCLHMLLLMLLPICMTMCVHVLYAKRCASMPLGGSKLEQLQCSRIMLRFTSAIQVEFCCSLIMPFRLVSTRLHLMTLVCHRRAQLTCDQTQIGDRAKKQRREGGGSSSMRSSSTF